MEITEAMEINKIGFKLSEIIDGKIAGQMLLSKNEEVMVVYDVKGLQEGDSYNLLFDNLFTVNVTLSE